MYELLIDHLLIDHIVVVMERLYENELNHHNEILYKKKIKSQIDFFFFFDYLFTIIFSIIKTDMNN